MKIQQDSIAGPDPHDSTTIKSKYTPVQLDEQFTPGKLRIGVPKEFFPTGLSASNLTAWERTVEALAGSGGATLVPISLPNTTFAMSCYSVLTSCEIASNFSRFDGLRFGHREPLQHSDGDKQLVSFEETITRNRDQSLGKVVKSRLVSGNYFLLKE
jgi:aspartyl-tRNA(Asn)/glutamyl-tRNA(Gln) amidotransferase subunit A